MEIKKAIIPAAGLGTRFLPFTKAVPKEMLPIVDTPTIEYIIREAINAGVEDILIILGRNKNSIEDYFDTNFELENNLLKNKKLAELEYVKKLNKLGRIHTIRQHQALGLGHAVNCAKTFVGKEPFLLLLGDEIIDNDISVSQQLIKKYKETKSSVVALKEVPQEDVNKYGIVEIENDKITNMIEKPNPQDAPSNLAIIGRYLLNPTIFEILPKIPPGRGGEIQLTDALLKLKDFEDLYSIRAIGNRYDIGSKLGYLKAVFSYALQDETIKDDLIEFIKNKI